jgi:hypothetical protein
MKLSYLNAIAALAMAALLSACGGSETYAVKGTVSGLNNSGLVLANGSDTVSVASGATSFEFPNKVSYGTDYNITVKTNPAHMTCTVSNGSASAGYTVEIAAVVTCAQNTYSLGGTFTGLTDDSTATARSVVLLNGSTGGSLTISSPTDDTGAGSFVFSSYVADGTAYGVTVLTQPTGLTCSITNGTGVMHEAAITNLVLTCVAN